MSAINLEKSIKTLKKSYVGKKNGDYQLDSSKVGDLELKVALFRANLAVENKEINKQDLIKQITHKPWMRF